MLTYSTLFSFPAYKCKYCDRAFAQSNDLVKHLRSHIGENTYQCSQCPKAFRLYSELREHGKTHFLIGNEVIESTVDPDNIEHRIEEHEQEIYISNEVIIPCDQIESTVTTENIVQFNIKPGIIVDDSEINDKSRGIAPSSHDMQQLIIQPMDNSDVQMSEISLQHLQETTSVKSNEPC